MGTLVSNSTTTMSLQPLLFQLPNPPTGHMATKKDNSRYIWYQG